MPTREGALQIPACHRKEYDFYLSFIFDSFICKGVLLLDFHIVVPMNRTQIHDLLNYKVNIVCTLLRSKKKNVLKQMCFV